MKMGGERAEEEGERKGRRRKEERRLEDSYLCYSTDAQQSHVSLVLLLSVSHKTSLIKLNGDTGERQGEIIRT
jgi:hypothetical protein